MFCLVGIDDEHRTSDPDSPWTEFYARRLLECLGPAEQANTDPLVLYHFEGCPYCARVRRTIDELGIEVELRDIFENREFLNELREARSRRTVPVLRIPTAKSAGCPSRPTSCATCAPRTARPPRS